MGNIRKETLEKLSSEGYECSFYDQYFNEVSVEKATEIRISNWDEQILGSLVRLPKNKEVTYERIMNTINAESEYMSIVSKVKALIDTENLRCYPATYGLGVETLFNKDWSDIDSIAEILTKLGIKYRTEVSEAGWVYRFVISKGQANIKKLQ